MSRRLGRHAVKDASCCGGHQVRLAKQAIVTSMDMPLHDALVADNSKLFVLSGTPEKAEAHGAFSARARPSPDA